MVIVIVRLWCCFCIHKTGWNTARTHWSKSHSSKLAAVWGLLNKKIILQNTVLFNNNTLFLSCTILWHFPRWILAAQIYYLPECTVRKQFTARGGDPSAIMAQAVKTLTIYVTFMYLLCQFYNCYIWSANSNTVYGISTDTDQRSTTDRSGYLLVMSGH